MKIFISYQYSNNCKIQLRKDLELLDSKLTEMGHETFIFWRDKKDWTDSKYEASWVWENIKNELDKSDALLALINCEQLSEGQCMEIGYANAKGIPVFSFVESKVKPYLREAASMKVFYYDKIDELLDYKDNSFMQETKVTKLVTTICTDFTKGLRDILGDNLYGVYIYGAAVFPDTLPLGDIDFHVILKNNISEAEKKQIETFHEKLAKLYPPLGGELDGFYILLEDVNKEAPPKSQLWNHAIDESWALHREHVLAGRCIVFFGPEPDKVYKHATWPELNVALHKELDYAKKYLMVYPDFCFLNLCRLIYSFETKEVVVSKAQAASWGIENLPEWRKYLELALKSYEKQATPEDRQFILDGIKEFFEFAGSRIEKASRK